MRRILLLLSFLSVFFCAMADEREGAPFKISFSLKIPQEAYTPLQSYLDLLIAARPIPENYILESYVMDREKETLQLSGRFMKSGEHTLFLGTFVWGSVLFTFPPKKIMVEPFGEDPLVPTDMLLPYPKIAFQETKENYVSREKLFEAFLHEGQKLLQNQRNFKNGLLLLGLFLLVSPVLFFLLMKNLQRRSEKKKQFSPREELSLIREKRDWTRLLALLQKLSGRKEVLTSYELARFFAENKKGDLAEASLLVERYGYLPEEASPRFDEAVVCIAKQVCVSIDEDNPRNGS